MLRDVPVETLRHARRVHYEKLGYTPKLGQRLFDDAVDSGKRFVGYFAPPQDGKSYHTAKHIGPYLMIPGTHVWLVGATYQDAAKEFGYLWADLHQIKGVAFRRKYFDIRGGNMHIELKNESWVTVISAENPENLRREQLDVVVLCEASKLNENLYDRYVYARIERRGGRVIVPTTHKGFGWVWTDFGVRAMPMLPGSGQWGPWQDVPGGAVRAKTGGDPNPTYDPESWAIQVSYVEEFGDVLHRGEYTPEQIAKARLRLPPPMFAEQFGGEACSYTGLVYPFTPLRHECDPFPIPTHWPIVVGYDHGAGGGSDPTAILLAAVAPDGTYYWFREIFDTQLRAVAQRATLLRVALGGRVPAMLYRGRDAKQAGRELLDAGFPNSYAPDGSVDARIIRMTALMQEGKWKLFRGCCPNLRREIGEYQWDEKHPGKPKDGNDHALEGAGYATLASVERPAATGVGAEAGETPEARLQRMLRDRLWKGWVAECDRQAQRTGQHAMLRVLDPNPFRASRTDTATLRAV